MQNTQVAETKTKFQVLNNLNELSIGSKVALFGAGETGQEFVRKLQVSRPDVEIVCFLDSFREGTWKDIPIFKPQHIQRLPESVQLIIASVFWNEIGDIVDQQYRRRYTILSNDLINQASHLSSYGSFYFSEKNKTELEERFSEISNKFRTPLDQDILRNVFDLRVYKREQEFFTYVDQLIRKQKKSFSTKDKYSNHLDLNGIGSVIEGGVFDGEDTYRLYEALKTSSSFKKLYAFDPFLESLYKGEYINKIDLTHCEFHQNILWDREEKIGFRVDRANPANSKVIRESEFAVEGYANASHEAITIDSFVTKNSIPVDLIKLDVEGSEMNVLNGARETILKYRPQLAISLYHRKEDLLEIPEFLLSLHKNYTFSISVNNPTFVDMVLYAS